MPALKLAASSPETPQRPRSRSVRDPFGEVEEGWSPGGEDGIASSGALRGEQARGSKTQKGSKPVGEAQPGFTAEKPEALSFDFAKWAKFQAPTQGGPGLGSKGKGGKGGPPGVGAKGGPPGRGGKGGGKGGKGKGSGVKASSSVRQMYNAWMKRGQARAKRDASATPVPSAAAAREETPGGQTEPGVIPN